MIIRQLLSEEKTLPMLRLVYENREKQNYESEDESWTACGLIHEFSQ